MRKIFYRNFLAGVLAGVMLLSQADGQVCASIRKNDQGEYQRTENTSETKIVNSYNAMTKDSKEVYFVRSSEAGSQAELCKLVLATGKVEVVLTAQNGITDLFLQKDRLYYSVLTKDASDMESYSMARNGSDEPRKECDGQLVRVTADRLYYLRQEQNTSSLLMKVSQTSQESKEEVLIKTKADNNLSFVKTAGDTDYYSLYDRGKRRIYLYGIRQQENSLKMILSRKNTQDDKYEVISDVKLLKGNLYINMGSYQGSGGFWYGDIGKLSKTGKLTFIAKNVSNDALESGNGYLYYDLSGDGTSYRYGLNSQKASKYEVAYVEGKDFSLVGSRMYLADKTKKNKILLSWFVPGGSQKKQTQFATIPFAKKAGLSYSVQVTSFHQSVLVEVAGIDYSDTSYGWRGRTVSENWYLFNQTGELLGSFQ